MFPCHNTVTDTIMSMENIQYFWLTKDTQYLAFTGELWGVFCEYFE